MPQIAQQDYLYINLSDYGLEDYALDEFSMNADLWAVLEKCFQNGTLNDVVLVDFSNAKSKILAYNTDEILDPEDEPTGAWELGSIYFIADGSIRKMYWDGE